MTIDCLISEKLASRGLDPCRRACLDQKEDPGPKLLGNQLWGHRIVHTCSLKYFSPVHFSIRFFRIPCEFFHKTFYGFAIYRMFCIANQIAINFGYENIHYIEYDCELLDKKLINENSKLLENYDSVIYTDNGKENGFLFGSFKSLKVKTLPENFKNYNKIENQHIFI